MEIETGKYAGFCGGVNLCVTTLNKEIEKEKTIYCLGEIVHNKDVVKSFENKGVIFVNSLDEVPQKSRLVIRAHGATKELYELAKERKMRLLDLTCPKVAKIREEISEFVNVKDTYILLIAKKDHPETKSTISFAGQYSAVAENITDIDNILKNIIDVKNIIVISQTTFNEEEFLKYANYLKSKVDRSINVIIKNTICNATSIRQEETRKMSKVKDCMIIIGGKNSSNTKKLYDISKTNCKNTYLVENVNDLDLKAVNKYNNIGIMAGASTPQEVISEIMDKLKSECTK